jgi:hypothetical protein
MDERVSLDDGVRLAAPRFEQLSPEMEREATKLLAALLADAARRSGVMPRPPSDASTTPTGRTAASDSGHPEPSSQRSGS